MKKIITALKLLAVSLFAISTAACTTTSIDKTYDFQDKVWRGEISRQFSSSPAKWSLSEDLRKRVHWEDAHDVDVRVAQIRFMDGQMARVASVFVPDQIEFADIEKGAIVDIILVPGPLTNFSTNNVNRILKLICRAKDEACIHKEKSEGRFSKVVDANPGNTFAKYGETFNRRATSEDYAQYK